MGIYRFGHLEEGPCMSGDKRRAQLRVLVAAAKTYLVESASGGRTG